jgi:tetratricopeptide (TPR) repeat protein
MRLEAEGQMWLVADLLEASDVARARAEHQRWASLAEHLQDNYQLWAVAVVRAMFTLLDGDLEASEREATEALNLAGEGYNANAAQLYGVQISNIRREQGRWAEFEEPLKALVVQFPVIATWRASLGALYAGAGRVDEAREQLAALARDGFAGLRKDTQWLANTMLAADTCSVVGDTAAAEWLYRELAPYRGRNVMAAPLAACWGSISRSLGVLAATLGDYSAAEAHFEDALADNERLGAAFCIARTLIEYARMVQARGQDGDADRAALLAKRALELAESRRLPLRQQQALDLLASLGDRPAPPG